MRLLFLLTFSLSLMVHGEIKPPNFEFKFEDLQKFFPGQSYNQIPKRYKPVSLGKAKGFEQIRIDMSHERYKFPVYLQVKDEKIWDMYAKLPSYFLHDVFLQSLVKRFGKQQKYYTIEQSAYYLWSQQENALLIYNSTCTLTCFPIFFTAYWKKEIPSGGKLEPYLKQFSKAEKPL